MKIRLDKFNRLDTQILLASPLGEIIGAMNDSLDVDVNLNFNTLSEITLRVPKTSAYYEKVTIMRNIVLTDIAQFVITSASEENDGVNKYKRIQAYSLERELVSRNTGQIKGTFKFYDAVNTENTLLGKLMSRIPNWKLGHVDLELYNIYRTFDIIDLSVYNFFMTDVEQTYGCIFKFDTFNRIINVYTPANALKETDIFISYSNLLKSTTIECNEEQICTALEVRGGGDLDIRMVNPLGTNFIYDYSYFMDNGWFSDGLSVAYLAWKKKLDAQTEVYSNKLLQLKTQQTNMLQYNVDLVELNTQLSALKQQQAVAVEASNQAEIKRINDLIKAKEEEIKAKESQISTAKEQIKATNDELTAINRDVSIQNNFTEEQLNELQYYTKEQLFQEPNIIRTTEMTDVQIMESALELKKQGENVLGKLKKPRYMFTAETANFLTIPAFAPFVEQLQLGCKMKIEIDTGFEIFKRTYHKVESFFGEPIETLFDRRIEDLFYDQQGIVEPVLLQIHFSLTDPNAFSMTWGDRLRLPNEYMDFEELLGKTINTTTQVNGNSVAWNDWTDNSQKVVVDFINAPLDASRNEVVNATNQQITIGGYGLKGQKKKDDGTYEPTQCWLTSSTLAFTKDGWNTASTALGMTTLPNGQKAYGIVAEAIIGSLIFGSQMVIQNEGGTIMMDANGYSSTTANGLGRVIMSPATGFALQSRASTSSPWVDKVFLDAQGNANFAGNISAGATINGATITGSIIIGGNINGVHTIIAPQAPFGIVRGSTGKVAELWADDTGGYSYLRMWSQKDTAGSPKYEIQSGGIAVSHEVDSASLDFRVKGASLADDPERVTGNFQVVADRRVVVESNGNMRFFVKRNHLTGTPNFLLTDGYAEFDNMLYCAGGLETSGSKKALVPTQHYGVRSLYCDESDRSYFTTKGIGETTNNKAVINLDPIFMETIELNHDYPYIINVTPYSNARVWIESVEDDKFVVCSDKDTKFSYQLNAIRITFGKEYLSEVTKFNNKQLKEIQESGVERMMKNA